MAGRVRRRRGGSPLIALATAAICVVVATVGASCSGSDDDSSASSAPTTASSSTVAQPGGGSKGPLPDCVAFDGGADLLADGGQQVGTAFSVTQGQLTFVALRVADAADPVVLVKVGSGAWHALDAGSATATGVPLDDGADTDASRASLGAQKAVECLAAE